MTSHNPVLTAAERVLWRQVIEAAHAAAHDPGAVGKAKDLKKALAPADTLRFPDLRPLPLASVRAFVTMARGFAAEPEAAVRAELAPRLDGMAGTAGAILDGLACDAPDTSAWSNRADLK